MFHCLSSYLLSSSALLRLGLAVAALGQACALLGQNPISVIDPQGEQDSPPILETREKNEKTQHGQGSPEIQEADPIPGSSLAALENLSLADLLQIEVQVASRQIELAASTPAALSVIESRRIARFALESVPEALRTMPGIHVARSRNEVWSVAIRGFNNEFGNKVSVFVDGRSQVVPFTGGVYWDFTDPFMPDIEQIEVVRGPGATLWGANAVNGVISIRTKHTRDTLGWFAQVGIGTETPGRFRVRYGDELEEGAGTWRVWLQGLEADGGVLENGNDANDDATRLRAGFRFDLELSQSDELELQGELGRLRQESAYVLPLTTPPFGEPLDSLRDSYSGFLSARWKRKSATSEWMASLHLERQGYEDYGFLDLDLDIGDFQLEHVRPIGEGGDLVAGVQYRIEEVNVQGQAGIFDFRAEPIANHLVAGFAQMRWPLLDGALRLVAGTKLEHNSFSGFEIQPSIRIATTTSDEWTAWASASRAVRTPTMIYRTASATIGAGFVPGLGVIGATYVPNELNTSEVALSYELGVRGQIQDDLQADLSLFLADYDRVFSFDELPPTFDPRLGGVVIPSTVGNGGKATIYGGEFVLTWAPSVDLRIDASYSLTVIDAEERNSPSDIVIFDSPVEGDSPEQLAKLNATWSPGTNWDLSLAASYSDRIDARRIDDFVRLDLTARWKIDDSWTLAGGGRDLLRRHHAEYVSDFFPVPIFIERSFWLNATYRF